MSAKDLVVGWERTGGGNKVLGAGVGKEVNPVLGVKVLAGEIGRKVIVVDILAVCLQVVLICRRLVVGVMLPLPVPVSLLAPISPNCLSL